jgi:hypothetical protein
MDACVKNLMHLAVALAVVGCSTSPAPVNVGAAGSDLVNIGDNAWRLTTIDNTEAEAARVGTNQAAEFCAKQGKAVFFASVRTANDMPARHISVMEFQCTARGNSPEAQAEARLRGFQRDCAIAGFPLGSPDNMKCAVEVAAKAEANAKAGFGN